MNVHSPEQWECTLHSECRNCEKYLAFCLTSVRHRPWWYSTMAPTVPFRLNNSQYKEKLLWFRHHFGSRLSQICFWRQTTVSYLVNVRQGLFPLKFTVHECTPPYIQNLGFSAHPQKWDCGMTHCCTILLPPSRLLTHDAHAHMGPADFSLLQLAGRRIAWFLQCQFLSCSVHQLWHWCLTMYSLILFGNNATLRQDFIVQNDPAYQRCT